MAVEWMEADLPRINKILKKLTAEPSCIKVERMGGMTNHSYHVFMDNGEEPKNETGPMKKAMLWSG